MSLRREFPRSRSRSRSPSPHRSRSRSLRRSGRGESGNAEAEWGSVEEAEDVERERKFRTGGEDADCIPRRTTQTDEDEDASSSSDDEDDDRAQALRETYRADASETGEPPAQDATAREIQEVLWSDADVHNMVGKKCLRLTDAAMQPPRKTRADGVCKFHQSGPRDLYTFKRALWQAACNLISVERKDNPLLPTFRNDTERERFKEDFLVRLNLADDTITVARMALHIGYPCGHFIMMRQKWTQLRDALRDRLRVLNIPVVLRNLKNKNDLIQLCVRSDVQFDFTPFIKSTSMHGNRERAGSNRLQRDAPSEWEAKRLRRIRREKEGDVECKLRSKHRRAEKRERNDELGDRILRSQSLTEFGAHYRGFRGRSVPREPPPQPLPTAGRAGGEAVAPGVQARPPSPRIPEVETWGFE